MSEAKKIHIELSNGKSVSLSYEEIGENIDVDKYLKIDHNQLLRDLATFHSITAKIGLEIVEFENQIRRKDFFLEVLGATIRKGAKSNQNALGKLTVKDLDDIVITDTEYIDNQLEIYSLQRNCSSLKELQKQAQNKSNALMVLAKKKSDDDLYSSFSEESDYIAHETYKNTKSITKI